MFSGIKAMLGLGEGSVSVQEAEEMRQQGAALVDVREREEFDEVHAQHAVWVPLSMIRAHGAEAFKESGLDINAQPLLMICRSGGRSAMACGLLSNDTDQPCINVRGGTQAWLDAGLPSEQGK